MFCLSKKFPFIFLKFEETRMGLLEEHRVVPKEVYIVKMD